jgi:cupin 2 domain-containing protein
MQFSDDNGASEFSIGNLFADVSLRADSEALDELLAGGRFRLERIVSTGQATAPGEWYDQEDDEWVVLLSGSAGLRFEDESDTRELKPGDFINIPAHCRHRVEWTDPAQPTVWLALHYQCDQN